MFERSGANMIFFSLGMLFVILSLFVFGTGNTIIFQKNYDHAYLIKINELADENIKLQEENTKLKHDLSVATTCTATCGKSGVLFAIIGCVMYVLSLITMITITKKKKFEEKNYYKMDRKEGEIQNVKSNKKNK